MEMKGIDWDCDTDKEAERAYQKCESRRDGRGRPCFFDVLANAATFGARLGRGWNTDEKDGGGSGK